MMTWARNNQPIFRCTNVFCLRYIIRLGLDCWEGVPHTASFRTVEKPGTVTGSNASRERFKTL